MAVISQLADLKKRGLCLSQLRQKMAITHQGILNKTVQIVYCALTVWCCNIRQDDVGTWKGHVAFIFSLSAVNNDLHYCTIFCQRG